MKLTLQLLKSLLVDRKLLNSFANVEPRGVMGGAYVANSYILRNILRS